MAFVRLYDQHEYGDAPSRDDADAFLSDLLALCATHRIWIDPGYCNDMSVTRDPECAKFLDGLPTLERLVSISKAGEIIND